MYIISELDRMLIIIVLVKSDDKYTMEHSTLPIIINIH